MFIRSLVVTGGLSLAAFAATAAPAAPAADTVYRNGPIYTADAHDRVVQALAVRDGRIVYAGTASGVAALTGAHTEVVDLAGQLAMPGLIDGHMHPGEGGPNELKCSLNYERLTLPALRERLQACLDATRAAEPDGWLEVVYWFQEGALPEGTTFSAADLDGLRTSRPVVLTSSFFHTMLVNRRGLALTGLTRDSVDPPGGRIGRDAAGEPNGLLEDDPAFEFVNRLLPARTPAMHVAAAHAALARLAREGVTSFLEALPRPGELDAYTRVARAGELSARAHFAPVILPEEAADPAAAIAGVVALARRYDQGALQAAPSVTVRNVKLFLDGVISAPAMTGALLRPYYTNAGSAAAPRWVPGPSRGPDVYFAAPVLKRIVLGLAAQGIEPHLHADGDRAVREGLDAYAALRAHYPGSRIRAALAHDELVDAADLPRFAALDVIPVLSLQWQKPAADTVDGARDYLGPERYPFIEPAGYLKRAGARIAFGSDWPVDPLDEWFALKVGVTRTAAPGGAANYAGRLGSDPGLGVTDVLRAITINAAYELHAERETGSLEVGKFADLIVLDRNVLTIPAEDIAHTRVLRTVVGGRTVYVAAARSAP